MPGVILVTASYDHTIKFWEATSGLCYYTIQHTESQINKLCITHNKEFLAAAGHKSIKLYQTSNNAANTKPLASFDGHSANIVALGFQQEDKWMYSGSEDGTIKIWDTRTITCRKDLKNGAAVNSLALHPNQGELFSVDEAGYLKLWDVAADKCVTTVYPTEGRDALRSVSLSGDGKRCVCASSKGDVYLYEIKRQDANPLKLIKKIKAHPTYILKCQISPHAKQLATASADYSIKLWDLTNDSLNYQQTLKGHKRWVWDIAYSSDSAYLVSASSDGTGRLWDISKGDSIREYKGHQKAVVCIALNDSPYGKKKSF
jgi:G protein beta subunit-like protein